MRRMSRLTSAAVGGLVLLVLAVYVPADVRAEARADSRADGPSPVVRPVSRVAAAAPGTIHGVVQDDHGAPVIGALVSAVGITKAFAVTDRRGRFELGTLAPGAYLLRAHSSGFIASRSQTIDVRPSSRVSSSIALKRATPAAAIAPAARTAPILQAGVGVPGPTPGAPAAQPAPVVYTDVPTDVHTDDDTQRSDAAQTTGDDHSELAWRLRHLRRSVLQEATGVARAGDDSSRPEPGGFGATALFGRAGGSPVRGAANFFTGIPLSGEFNFLTTTSFNDPQQLFNGEWFARNVAYMSVGAPAGSNADWAVRGALSQADISAWVVAGTYSTRGPARHHYDLGLSYATQRYDGGNPAALRDVTDGSRNAGAVYGFDTWTISPALALTYGARYARYDYLESKGLISPRASFTVSAGDNVRVSTTASRRSIAPGAEEFLPPGDTGLWLPPQRTFSTLVDGRPLEAEHTAHFEVEVERDLGPASAIVVRAFQQYVTDQLVTMFGRSVRGLPSTNLGHYFVGSEGDVDARGLTAGFRTAVSGRVTGSVEYSLTHAQWRGDDVGVSLLQLPLSAPLRSDRIHDVSTSIQTDVPETSTRVVVLYRVSNAFARQYPKDDRPLDSRFDVQIHQSLPFMDFSTAKWEMLVGVRNFFRETAPGQSMFDELLVVRPPKRIVGGLTMRF